MNLTVTSNQVNAKEKRVPKMRVCFERLVSSPERGRAMPHMSW